MTPQIATANRLHDGLVVFLGTRGWVERIDQATVAYSAGEVKALDALVKQAEAVNEVVAGYLVEIEPSEAGLQPLHYRERIRVQGPTVRRDLGKQAQG